MKPGNAYLLISTFIMFILLLLSALKGIFIGIPLTACFFNYACIVRRRGYSFRDIAHLSYQGGRKSLIVLRILVLVGAITSLWIASGTTSAILYYGIKLIDPKLFIMYAFLISCGVSFLLGTSFGTVSTVGLSLILMAKSGRIDANIAAGAIIAGAYFGDRCSPMSSSANLVAHLTETDLYANIRQMTKTGFFPLVLSLLAYLGLSWRHPLTFTENSLLQELSRTFSLHWFVLLPALVILLFALFKIDVKKSMLVSILLAFLLSICLQHYTVLEALKISLFGFDLNSNSPLKSILKGGGIFSMWKVAVVVYISCCWAGLLSETDILNDLDEILLKVNSRWGTFLLTTIVSIATSVLGCSQTISIVLTHSLIHKVYVKNSNEPLQEAVDLENTSIPLAAVIPWNTAAFVPSSTLSVSLIGFIPYACYLYFLPLWQFFYLKFIKPCSS